MKLKTMINLLRDTQVNIYCDDRLSTGNDTFIIHNCNYACILPKELLKYKVTAVIPDYIRNSVNIYVINK